jgi:hypothetical protein
MEAVKKYTSFGEIKSSGTIKNTNPLVFDEYATLINELRLSMHSGNKKRSDLPKKEMEVE